MIGCAVYVRRIEVTNEVSSYEVTCQNEVRITGAYFNRKALSVGNVSKRGHH